jgi:hypothetical protein
MESKIYQAKAWYFVGSSVMAIAKNPTMGQPSTILVSDKPINQFNINILYHAISLST